MPTATDASVDQAKEPSVDEIAQPVVKDTSCFDEAAQSIVKDLQDQQDAAKKPEPVEQPGVACVRKPEFHPEVMQEDGAGNGEQGAGGLESPISPTDSLADDDKNANSNVEGANIPNHPQPLSHVKKVNSNGEGAIITNPPPSHDNAAAPADHTEDGIASVSPGRSFPELLYDIISDPATDDVCGWLPHGKGFVIHDKNRFGSEILPRYFDGTKFTSFTRRLKRWSFTRIARGAELGAYYNENFVRDHPTKVMSMRYRVVHGDVVGAAAATMASGGTRHAATAAALAAAAMLEGKKKGKGGKSKRAKKNDSNDAEMADGTFRPQMGGMMVPQGFPMPWGPYGMPMMMPQQYMMMQQQMAQNFGFNNYMNMQDPNNMNGMMPQQQFQGNMNGNFPMMNMHGMPPNMQGMMPPQFQGDPNMMQQQWNQGQQQWSNQQGQYLNQQGQQYPQQQGQQLPNQQEQDPNQQGQQYLNHQEQDPYQQVQKCPQQHQQDQNQQGLQHQSQQQHDPTPQDQLAANKSISRAQSPDPNLLQPVKQEDMANEEGDLVHM